MSDWLRLKDIPESESEQQMPDMMFNILVSPYDIPDAVRGYKTDSGRFKIEFKYIDGEEPGQEIKVDEFVTATEGQHSGRLLVLDIDIKSLGAKSCGIAIGSPVPMETMKQGLNTAWKQYESQNASTKEKRFITDTMRRAFATREDELLNQLIAD